MKVNSDARQLDDDIRRRLPQAGKMPGPAAPAAGSARGEAKANPKPRRGFLYSILLGLLICLVLGVAAVSVSAPVVASMLMQATATPPAQFAYADIARPSYTPSPTITPLPSITPSPVSTETPGVMEVVIVEDAAVTGGVQASNAPAYTGNKYILVDISEQHMYVYEGDALLWSFVASTGMNNATRVGSFQVQSKIPNAYGATWNIWMPNWLGIYWAGGLENGIHALPILPGGARLWSGFLGSPVSYGCVVLGEYESSLLYEWAEIGTPVEIRW